jgi:hypothetical protein
METDITKSYLEDLEGLKFPISVNLICRGRGHRPLIFFVWNIFPFLKQAPGSWRPRLRVVIPNQACLTFTFGLYLCGMVIFESSRNRRQVHHFLFYIYIPGEGTAFLSFPSTTPREIGTLNAPRPLLRRHARKSFTFNLSSKLYLCSRGEYYVKRHVASA